MKINICLNEQCLTVLSLIKRGRGLDDISVMGVTGEIRIMGPQGLTAQRKGHEIRLLLTAGKDAETVSLPLSMFVDLVSEAEIISHRGSKIHWQIDAIDFLKRLHAGRLGPHLSPDLDFQTKACPESWQARYLILL